MAPQATPMLFAPPRPPLPLPAEGRVVLGRSRSCDVKLQSPDASRRHAEIVAVPAGYLIRDLGSTNGTFVNGERIDVLQLRPGDRIEIGADALTFCELDPALEAAPQPADEAQTQMQERPALGQCITGNLSEIPPFAVLQILEMGRKSGVLEVDTELGPGRLWLHEGDPIHAETKGQRGFDAAIAIVGASSGRFSFEPGQEPPERTIEASATELLLEASRQLDEDG